MKTPAIVLIGLACATALATLSAGTANAAIVSFQGADYSQLQGSGSPGASWIESINDTVDVRVGDSMQFQNRWYDGFAGTVDVRISYGGSQPYVCTGADEYVYLGLNYGDYYPATDSAVPFYATVRNVSDDPLSVIVNHQYVYNGVMYGAGPTGVATKGGSVFVKEADDASEQDAASVQPAGETTADTPAPADQPAAPGTPLPTATASAAGAAGADHLPASSPGFGTGTLLLAAGLTIADLLASVRRGLL